MALGDNSKFGASRARFASCVIIISSLCDLGDREDDARAAADVAEDGDLDGLVGAASLKNRKSKAVFGFKKVW